jgi:hypothetical protein
MATINFIDKRDTVFSCGLLQYEIISFLSSIYDLNNLSLTSKYMFGLLRTKKSEQKILIKAIIDTNLTNIFKIDLNNMNLHNFECFCKEVGLVLSGSVMLKSITGDNWGLENNLDNQNEFLLVDDLDTYVDHNFNLNNNNPDINLLSKYVEKHKYKYDYV